MDTLTKIRRKKMLAQRGRCYYCGLPMWDKALDQQLPKSCRSTKLPKALQCTAEHLKPRSEGGEDSEANVVAACIFCNAARHRRKRPRSPADHLAHVRKRMDAGRWLRGSTKAGSSLPE